MACARAVLLLALMAGCAPQLGAEDDTAIDGGGGVDGLVGEVDAAGEDAGGGCGGLPAAAPAWLQGYQQEVVGKLSGQMEIAAGVTLSDRSTGTARTRVRTFLVNELAALGYTAELESYSGGANVRAELAADQAGGPLLVVGAHFDTVSGSPGANDNATGVAMVLAAARWLPEVTCRRMTVVFYFFDQEEIGLVGSYHAAAAMAGDGRPVAAVHTIDQMGWDANDDRLIELERPATAIAAAYDDARTAGGFSTPIVHTTTESSDHTRFRNAGFAATGVTEGYVSGDTTPYYHQSGDSYATVDFAYLADSSGLLHVTLARTARSTAQGAPVGPPPPFAPLPACRDTNGVWAN